ncbi:MAG: glycosyltransferase family 4 protein [Clostridiaceae bacterium]
MKVLQIINNLDIGGAETLLKNYVLKNSDADIENHICILEKSDTFILDELQKNNIKIFILGLPNKYSAIKALKRLREIIGQGCYDCVHVHLFPGQYYGAKLADEFKNTHFIFTEHSTYNKRRDIKPLYPVEKWSYSKYENVLCISRTTAKTLNAWMPSIKPRLRVVYGGIAINQIQRIREPFYDAVLVGSMRGNEKGVDIFIKAIKTIENYVRHIAIVGEGILKDDMMSLRDSLGLKDKIEFTGNVDNVNEYLSNSKMFVLPSRWEGFGLAILEAMAARLPVVATNVGGIPEIVTDGKDGILVPPEDVIALGKNMLYVLNNRDMAAQLAENAYRTVTEKFSIEAYAERLNILYKELCLAEGKENS